MKASILLFLITFLLRIAGFAGLYLFTDPTVFSFPVNGTDAAGYLRIAHNLLEHGAFSVSLAPPFLPDSFRTPLYPFFVAFSLMLGSIYFLPVLQAIIAGLSAVALHLLSKQFMPGAWAFLVGIFFAIDPLGIFLSNLALSETLFTGFLVASLYFAMRDLPRYGLAGILLGAATVTRPIGVLLAPIFLLAFALKRSWKPFVVFTLLFLAVITPWSIRNKIHFDSWQLADVSIRKLFSYDAALFYAYNHNVTHGEATQYMRDKLLREHRVEFQKSTLADADAVTSVAVGVIRENPAKFVLFYATKSLPFFFTDGLSDIAAAVGFIAAPRFDVSGALFRMDVSGLLSSLQESYSSTFLFFLGAGFWSLVVLLMITGVALSWKRRHLRRYQIILLFGIVVLTGFLSGTVSNYRLRHPVTPLMFLLAVEGLYMIFNKQQGEHIQSSALKSDWTFFDDMLRTLRIRKIKRFVPKNSVICDLGCGHEAFLLKYFQNYIQKGYGFDKDAPIVSTEKYEVKNMMLDAAIPLPDNSVDVVTLLASLEHFHNEEMILREVRRILKPGGSVLITVPTEKNKPLLEFLAKVGVISAAEIMDHKRYYTKEYLKGALHKAGFEEKNVSASYWQFGLNLFARGIKS